MPIYEGIDAAGATRGKLTVVSPKPRKCGLSQIDLQIIINGVETEKLPPGT